MAILTFPAFKKKWADLTGRFKTNITFDIAEDDYREFSADIADSILDPVEKLQVRVEKLENPAPQPREGIKWRTAPKVSIDEVTNDVLVEASEAEFDALTVPFAAGIAKAAVPAPPDGFGTRVDILAATSTGWAYIFGEEPGVTPPMVLAGDPEADLLFAAYLFWTSAGGEVETPVVYIQVVEINGVDHMPDPSGRLILPPFSPGVLEYTPSLPFDKDYLVNWPINGPTAFTKNALNFKPGAFIKGNITADGVNKPTFSTDFIINYYEYVNTAGRQHRVYFEAQADGKILVDIVYA